ncbi:hypothetical protein DTB58_12575, partial [Streptomyces griseus]|nr:hypothetical protein [Streptomyces griseus]
MSRDGQITDRVGALGDRTGQVEDALDRLYADERVQLFVVYVRDFSGRSGQAWSDETADRNGLGQDDVLLSVATHDRQYAYSVDVDSRLTDARLREVAGTAIEPALRENDWAGAALGAAGVVGRAGRLADGRGFGSFRLKGGVFEPDREMAAIRALAEAFPGRPLRLDPSGAWSVPTSLYVAGQ